MPAKPMTETNKEKARRIARVLYAKNSDHDIEIDEDARVTDIGDGRSCWVYARVWVADADFEDVECCPEGCEEWLPCTCICHEETL